MGLFNRKNPYEKEALDLEAALRATPDRADLRPRAAPQPLAPQAPPLQAPTLQVPVPMPTMMAAPTLPPKSEAYGIEDAIQLMRELPDNKKEMVIAIVQKTLISAKINVSTILDDASRKIDRLERRNEKLAQEIGDLEEAIQQRKLETATNARDIEETREVKESFENAQRPTLDDKFVPAPYFPDQKVG